MSVGMVAGAIVGPGMGGFVAEFGSVSYSQGNAEIYPTLADHAACDNAPQLEVSLKGETTLNGNVTFYKDLPLPSEFDSATGMSDAMARISIRGSTPTDGATVDNLGLRLTALEAEEINLGGTNLREYGPNSYDDGSPNASFAPPGNGSLDPTAAPERVPEFGLDASFFNLPDGGTGAAHHVSLGSITLSDVNLYVLIDDKSDFANPVENVVQPTERDCEALVAAS